MQIELIRKQWSRYENLVSSETVAQAMSNPQRMLKEEIEYIIPNIELASDGPVVRAIFMFTANYIGEARLSEGSEYFDVMLKNTVVNYRVSLGRHEVIRNAAAIEAAKAKNEVPPAPYKVVYQKAEVVLSHSYSNFTSEINYFGNDLDAWVESVESVIPVSILKVSSVKS